MGIPLFFTPVEPAIASKSAEKIPARQRSSIRRTRPAGSPRMSPEARWRRLIHDTANPQDEYEVVELPTQRSAPSRNEYSASVPHPLSSRAGAPRLEYEQLHNRHEQLRTRMRDDLSQYGRSEPWVIDGPLLPPAPDSEDTQDTSEASRRVLPWERESDTLSSVEARRRQYLRRLARRRAAPTPPMNGSESFRSVRSTRGEPDERRSILLSGTSSMRSSLSGEESRGQRFGSEDVSIHNSRGAYLRRVRPERAGPRFTTFTTDAADSEALAARVAALSQATDRYEEADDQSTQTMMEELEASRRTNEARMDGLRRGIDGVQDASRRTTQTMMDELEASRRANEARMDELDASRRAELRGVERGFSPAYIRRNASQRRRAFPTGFDGLGDRERSLSPEVAAWDTLLSSIAPDPQAPSAGSSFASSAAAAASSGPVSAGTSMTSHDAVSANDSGDANYDICEASDPPTGDEDDDEDSELRGVNHTARRLNRTYADAMLVDEVARYTRRSAEADRNPWDGEGEGIHGLQQIIAGLSERDDVPDEWWASAGVSRNMRRDRRPSM